MDDINNRTTGIIKIFKKLKEFDLGHEKYEELVEFKKICNTYIKDGKSVSGKIKIHGTKRVLCYDFNKKNIESKLIFNENV